MNVPDYMIYQNKEYRIITDHVGTPKLLLEAATGKTAERFETDEFGMLEKRERKHLI